MWHTAPSCLRMLFSAVTQRASACSAGWCPPLLTCRTQSYCYHAVSHFRTHSFYSVGWETERIIGFLCKWLQQNGKNETQAGTEGKLVWLGSFLNSHCCLQVNTLLSDQLWSNETTFLPLKWFWCLLQLMMLPQWFVHERWDRTMALKMSLNKSCVFSALTALSFLSFQDWCFLGEQTAMPDSWSCRLIKWA